MVTKDDRTKMEREVECLIMEGVRIEDPKRTDVKNFMGSESAMVIKSVDVFMLQLTRFIPSLLAVIAM